MDGSISIYDAPSSMMVGMMSTSDASVKTLPMGLMPERQDAMRMRQAAQQRPLRSRHRNKIGLFRHYQ